MDTHQSSFLRCGTSPRNTHLQKGEIDTRWSQDRAIKQPLPSHSPPSPTGHKLTPQCTILYYMLAVTDTGQTYELFKRCILRLLHILILTYLPNTSFNRICMTCRKILNHKWQCNLYAKYGHKMNFQNIPMDYIIFENHSGTK